MKTQEEYHKVAKEDNESLYSEKIKAREIARRTEICYCEVVIASRVSGGRHMALKKRQRLILQALADLGGQATTRQIAEKTNMQVNGVSQSLGAMHSYVQRFGGRGGETWWKIKTASIRSLARLF